MGFKLVEDLLTPRTCLVRSGREVGVDGRGVLFVVTLTPLKTTTGAGTGVSQEPTADRPESTMKETLDTHLDEKETEASL